jgi:hypothetical protein
MTALFHEHKKYMNLKNFGLMSCKQDYYYSDIWNSDTQLTSRAEKKIWAISLRFQSDNFSVKRSKCNWVEAAGALTFGNTSFE